jgi:hypothetical protein
MPTAPLPAGGSRGLQRFELSGTEPVLSSTKAQFKSRWSWSAQTEQAQFSALP